MNIPNFLSASRFVMALAIAYAVTQAYWLVAAVVLTIAIATDLADGWLARRTDAVTNLGGLLDHSADAFFVSMLLAALAWQGVVTPVLPVLVIAAFLQYMLDSKALAGQALRASYLGRYNGIAYFVLAGFPVYQPAVGLTILGEAPLYYLSCGLVISTVISMADRLFALVRR